MRILLLLLAIVPALANADSRARAEFCRGFADGYRQIEPTSRAPCPPLPPKFDRGSSDYLAGVIAGSTTARDEYARIGRAPPR